MRGWVLRIPSGSYAQCVELQFPLTSTASHLSPALAPPASLMPLTPAPPLSLDIITIAFAGPTPPPDGADQTMIGGDEVSAGVSSLPLPTARRGALLSLPLK